MFNALADLVWPRECVGCGVPGVGLCQRCAAISPIPVPGLGVLAYAAGSYDAALRAALLRYKERGRTDLAPVLAGLLSFAVGKLDAPSDAVIVGVPSSAASRRSRGYDHLRPLLARVGRYRGLRVGAPLRFTREVVDSAGLGAGARAENLAGAMAAQAPPSENRPVIVADDIITTGATAREACRALLAAGWELAGFAAVAATARGPGGVPRQFTADGQARPLARSPNAV